VNDIDKPKQVRYNMSMEIINKYLSEIGKKGGSKRSRRKTHACRENGKLGGRPKGTLAGKLPKMAKE